MDEYFSVECIVYLADLFGYFQNEKKNKQTYRDRDRDRDDDPADEGEL